MDASRAHCTAVDADIRLSAGQKRFQVIGEADIVSRCMSAIVDNAPEQERLQLG